MTSPRGSRSFARPSGPAAFGRAAQCLVLFAALALIACSGGGSGAGSGGSGGDGANGANGGGGTSSGGANGGNGGASGGTSSGGSGSGSGGGSGASASGSGGGNPGSGSGTQGDAGAGAGGATGADGGAAATDPAVWINQAGAVKSGSNPFGIAGPWYAFGDGVTSTQTGNPYTQGKYCVQGTALADGNSAHWGVGIGLDLNASGGTKQPYMYQGKLTGFRIRLEGTVPDGARVHFVTNTTESVSPFVAATLNQTVVYQVADARVPLDWNVTNAGERADGGTLYSIQVEVPADVAGPINLCITDFAPVNDATAGGTTTTSSGGTYINSDGWVTASNAFGITGQVYAISDGTSTTQTGNPYTNGKYCVAGTFTGAANAWGAGIAFDLNHPPGGTRAAYANSGKVAGFRIALSGSSPGFVHINFVTNDPPSGTQPFLVGRIGTTQTYRIDWAEVPPSWSVSNAGATVGSSLYTIQVALDGSKAGPFNVCVEDFTPLAAADITETAMAAATGYTGARTIDQSILADEYTAWKASHFMDCNDGTACVPRDTGDCISEGIGYGMLLSVANNDRAAFDKFWAYYMKHQNSNGVMSWQTNVCGGNMATGSATDGDLDAATGLIQAGCRWGGTYRQQAVTLINALKNHAITTCNGLTVLKPGDNFGGCDRTDPSYFAPGYYKLYSSVASDATWTTLANDSYTLLAKVQSAMKGLASNWTDSTGAIPSGTDGTYGNDAARVPWRIATDYVWNNEPKAVTFLNAMSTYIDANGGIQRLFAPNSAFRGGLAMSGLQQTSSKAQMYTDAWLQTSSEQDDAVYYPGTLRLVYMLIMAQVFPNGC